MSASGHHNLRSLLMPDEVRNLPLNQKVLSVVGMRPVCAAKLRYYADMEFRVAFQFVLA